MAPPKVIHRRYAGHGPLDTQCRLWQGSVDAGGYGVHHYEGNRPVFMHRWVIQQVGQDQYGTPWDPGLHVLHLCDRPACFRFDHLMLGTQAENNRQAAQRGRQVPGSGRPRKLSEYDVRVIRERQSRGDIQADIARAYGVSESMITRIKRMEL